MSKQLGALSVLVLLAACAPPSSVDRIAVERPGDAAADGVMSDAVIFDDARAGAAGGSGATDVATGGPAIPPAQGSGGAVGGTGAATGGVSGGAGGSGGASAGGGAGVDTAPETSGEGTPDAIAPDVVPPATARLASLVVADPKAMAATDTKLKTLLEGKGFTVKLGDDDQLGSQSDGATLVVLSATCASEKIATKYRDTPIATLVLEPGSFDDMMMTGAAVMKDFGSDNATQIAITAADHALAAQLKGNVTVVRASTKLGWGKPAATALNVASLGGMADKAAIFAYEKGAAMVPLLAPARRVAMFVTVTAAANLNADGDKLLAAAIAWLTASPP